MLGKLTRRTLADQAVDSLIEFIETRSLKPGDSLPSEAKLAMSLGVSRPIVREAIKALAGKNIIEMINGKGAVVKSLDGENLRAFFQYAIRFNSDAVFDIMEVRRALEIESARLAAERATEEELTEIEGMVQGMRKALHDYQRFVDLDVEFHLQIAAATHNSTMYFLIGSIRDSVRNVIMKGLQSRQSEEELNRVQELHEGIFAALRARAVEDAGQAMSNHFDDAVSALVTGRHGSGLQRDG